MCWVRLPATAGLFTFLYFHFITSFISSVRQDALSIYRNESNYSNHPIIRTPPFSRKNVVFQAFNRTPTFEIIIPNPNSYTLQSLIGGRRMFTRLSSLCGTPTEFAERLLSFDSLCGARARVTEHLLAYYRRLRTSTRLLQSCPNIY